MNSKEQVRLFVQRQKQTLLSEERRILATQRLLNILRNREDFLSAKRILLYSALPDEVPTHEVLKEWGSEKMFLLPSLLSDGTIALKTYVSNELMVRGKYNILEPKGECFSDYQQIDLAFIPGVAFDNKNHRCGRGKGYYDRFLSHPHLTELRTVGIAFDFQVIPEIPIEEHDKQLHDLIIV